MNPDQYKPLDIENYDTHICTMYSIWINYNMSSSITVSYLLGHWFNPELKLLSNKDFLCVPHVHVGFIVASK